MGDGVELTILGDRNEQQTHGDLLDQSTSPNDPLFMFHHANLDRYLMEWQLQNYADGPYFGYPESGYSDLCRLDDIVAPDFPFEHLFRDEMADVLGAGPYTARDIWDGTTFVDAPYVYDSVLNMISREIEDDNGSSNSDGLNQRCVIILIAFSVLISM